MLKCMRIFVGWLSGEMSKSRSSSNGIDTGILCISSPKKGARKCHTLSFLLVLLLSP